MLMPRLIAGIFSFGLMVLGAAGVFGQDFPTKPIRIFTSAAGGGNDFMARLVAQGLAGPLDQPMIVENRVVIVSIETVAKAPPDGYTLLLGGNTLWYLPFLRDDVPWDALRDFSPVTLAAVTPNVLVVHPSLPVKSVKDLIALAKSRPGALNYSTGASGTAQHFAAELFKAMAGVDIVRINYKGGGPATNALIAGEVELAFNSASSVTPHVKSGRLRALAVTSAQPSALAPGLPTVAASGLPGYESLTLTGIYVPAKTPTAIMNRLNQEIVRVLNAADVREKLLRRGVEVVGNSPEQFAAAIKSDMTTVGKLIKDAGIRGE